MSHAASHVCLDIHLSLAVLVANLFNSAPRADLCHEREKIQPRLVKRGVLRAVITATNPGAVRSDRAMWLHKRFPLRKR